MSVDEINAAIAESLGIVSEDQHGKLYRTEQGYVRECPNYHGSLDAIVPVVSSAEESIRYETVCHLSRMTITGPLFASYFATPAQWCEAYLKSKGLWK